MNPPKQQTLFPVKFDIWVEGYLCTGMEGIPAPARKVGSVEATSFDEAVARWVSYLPTDERGLWKRHPDGRWSVWGCGVYDNETDARKAFG